MSSIIKVKHLKKVYNPYSPSPTTALHDINLEITKGQFITIMGPSGCGKTTLINILSTIDTPTSGSVFLFDNNIATMSETQTAKLRKTDISFTFQDYNLIATLKNRDNILFSMRLNKRSKEEQEVALSKIATELGISEILDKYPFECSGGQQQRIAIARAIIVKPKIIFADEPTGNLDSLVAKELMELFVAISNNNQTTIVMVTHDSFVASYATQMYYMQDGNIMNHLVRDQQSQEEYYRQIMKTTSHFNL